jgi:YVTN family beta-propeller protein
MRKIQTALVVLLCVLLADARRVEPQAALPSKTPSPALLVLEKADSTLAIIDARSLQVAARVPAGPDPHEVIVSDDGRLAYISNYGGPYSTLHTISVVDLTTQKALAPINLGALHGAHGLDFAGGKLYFTAEVNKVIGRYDPATQSVEWVLGTGQDRTHMIAVSPNLQRIVTSNVASATLCVIDQTNVPVPANAPLNSAAQKSWEVTVVPAGHGSEGFDVSPDGREIWVANALDQTATIIDAQAKKVIQTIPIAISHANRLKFTPDGKKVLISGAGDGQLDILDAPGRREIKRLRLGRGAEGILMQPSGTRAFVAVSPDNKVAVVDLKTLEVSDEIAVGKGPDGMAWAARK